MTWRRAKAFVLAAMLDPRRSSFFIASLICLHAVTWTVVLAIARTGESLNPDSTEMYAWGRLWLWGYGKHPPLAGWIARLWFDWFPTADWAMYALIITVTAAAAWLGWLIAIRVVERRRAVAFVLLLLIYPIFNFRGARYGTDLPLVPMFLLVTLAFLVAFEARTAGKGALLGVACAAAVLTKYWALLVVGATVLSALAHPKRARFFLSPAPYVAVLVFLAAMTPHLIWLVQSDYAPFHYAARYTEMRSYSPLVQIGRALRLQGALLLPVVLAFGWAVYRNRVTLGDASHAVRADAARHIQTIAAVLLVLPPLMALALGVYYGVDWGTPLYTLLPLAALAMPRLGVPQKAPLQLMLVVAAMLACGLAVAPVASAVLMKTFPQRYQQPLPELAADVSRLWRERFNSALPVVAGPKFVAAGISFYSPDHPIMFTNFDRRIATWIDPESLRRSGLVAVCPEAYQRLCEEELARLALVAERVTSAGFGEETARWAIYIVRPGAPS